MINWIKDIFRSIRGRQDRPEKGGLHILETRKVKSIDANGSSPYFEPQGTADAVGIEAHARSAGRNNLPVTTASDLNEFESAIVRDHERQHRDLVESTRGRLRTLTTDVDNLREQLPRREDLGGVVEETMAQIDHDLARANIETPRQEQERTRRDLRLFQRENLIDRDAQYPDSVWFHVAVVVGIGVAECCLNAGFFAGASDRGVLGGLWQAIGVAAVNVAAGFAAGYFAIRYLHVRRPFVRQLAIAGVVAYALFAVLFNWAVARYRDLMFSGAADEQQLLDVLLRDPWNLSFHSLVLLVLGMLASGLSTWKGYRCSDSIPGHKECDVRFRNADRAFHAAVDGLREQVLARARGIPDECRSIVREGERLLEQLGQKVVEATRAIEGYEASRKKLSDRCDVMLRRYRDENCAVRTTPAPRYFNSFPTFSSEIDRQAVDELEARLAAAREELDHLKEEARRIRNDNPERVHLVNRSFEAVKAEQLRRADEHRGDGSGAPSIGPVSITPEEAVT